VQAVRVSAVSTVTSPPAALGAIEAKLRPPPGACTIEIACTIVAVAVAVAVAALAVLTPVTVAATVEASRIARKKFERMGHPFNKVFFSQTRISEFCPGPVKPEYRFGIKGCFIELLKTPLTIFCFYSKT
jgi:hypothetical protein